MHNVKPCKTIPYNAKSVKDVYEDFKNMIHLWAIKNSRSCKGRVNERESLSIAHEAFLMALGTFDPKICIKGNTKDGFGLYLSSTLRIIMLNERAQFVKRMGRVVPESYYTQSVADSLLKCDFVVNGDYGQQAHADNVRLSIEAVLGEHTYEWTEQETTVIRNLYGLETGEKLTLRACGELVGMSHEAVSQKNKSALEKVQFSLNRDIRQYRRK